MAYITPVCASCGASMRPKKNGYCVGFTRKMSMDGSTEDNVDTFVKAEY